MSLSLSLSLSLSIYIYIYIYIHTHIHIRGPFQVFINVTIMSSILRIGFLGYAILVHCGL